MRPAKRVVALVAAVVLLLALLAPAASAAPVAVAAVDPARAEGDFLERLNDVRQQHGARPLLTDPAASAIARSWSSTMAKEDVLRHNPALAASVTAHVGGDWRRLGENVGVGGTVAALHDAFWASPAHRSNMVGDFNRVGIGVVTTDRIWVTVVFVSSPSLPVGVPACTAPGYLLDGFGGVHAVDGAPALRASAYWRGWDIARDLTVVRRGDAGYVLDGFGGLHPVGAAPPIRPGAYWPGRDVATAVAATPDGRGAYVLDAYGGVHGAGTAPPVRASAYWRGWPIARDVAVDATHGARGYVLDGLGGLHPFGGMPPARLSRYFGKDVARSFVLLHDGSGGYVVDRWGGVFPFAVGNRRMPPMIGASPLFGGPRPEVVLLGKQPTVVTAAGAEIGAGSQQCAEPARWGTWPILRSAVAPA